MIKLLSRLALLGLIMSFSTAVYAQSPQELEEEESSTHLDIKTQKKMDSKFIRSHFDLSVYHFIPAGVKIIEQPERSRILFQSKGRIPAGYAERKGEAIIYYNGQGQAIRVQRLTMAEMDRIERR